MSSERGGRVEGAFSEARFTRTWLFRGNGCRPIHLRNGLCGSRGYLREQPRAGHGEGGHQFQPQNEICQLMPGRRSEKTGRVGVPAEDVEAW